MTRKSPRHAFRFKDLDGNEMPPIWAEVKKATRRVEIILKAEHVAEAIRRRGIGDTQNCSMAVCAKNNREVFPHPVEGYIDWQYTRAFIVSKVYQRSGRIVCVVYEHGDEIAKMNDSIGGQRRLLAELEANGPRTIVLYPVRPKVQSTQPRPHGNRTGARSSRPAYHGAKGRFAFSRASFIGS